jgi:predicted nucleotidyltransferase
MDQAARCGGRYPADGTGADCVPKAGASIYNPPQRQDPFKDQIMDERLAQDQIITRFRAALDDIYGARLERVVLFGSRARGDARPDSDYDVAVFLRSLPDRWRERDRLADLRVRFIDDTGAFFDARPYPTSSYRDDTPLMYEIRREGLDL